jgi:hypothetical protein
MAGKFGKLKNTLCPVLTRKWGRSAMDSRDVQNENGGWDNATLCSDVGLSMNSMEDQEVDMVGGATPLVELKTS